MGKLKVAIIVVLILWALSFLASSLLDLNIGEKVATNKIITIPISGFITIKESDIPFGTGYVSSTKIVSYIEQADKDPNVKGIIFEINSAGGGVVASREIANAIKKVNKPTTAWIREVGASGGYLVASACDNIVADPLSITGSIGVAGSYLEFSGFMEEYGIGYESIKAGEYKDAGSPFRKLTDEERELIQSKIDKVHDVFIDDVTNNRKLSKAYVKELANGMFYLGTEAKDAGLVDYLGGKDLAVEITRAAANMTEATLIQYKEKRSIFDLLGKFSASSSYYIGKGIGSEMYSNMKATEQIEIIA